MSLNIESICVNMETVFRIKTITMDITWNNDAGYLERRKNEN